MEKPCCARCFDLLLGSPLSSIYIHFGVELLVFGVSLTSASLSKNKFFDRLTGVFNMNTPVNCILSSNLPAAVGEGGNAVSQKTGGIQSILPGISGGADLN